MDASPFGCGLVGTFSFFTVAYAVHQQTEVDNVHG